MIYGSTTPLQSLTELSDMGYHLVFRPLSGKLLLGYRSLTCVSNKTHTFFTSTACSLHERLSLPEAVRQLQAL